MKKDNANNKNGKKVKKEVDLELNDKKVESQVLEAVLADNTEGFMYIDTYEDSVHWGQIRYEIKNGSIQNIDEQFDSVSKCTSGRMYDAEQS